MRSGTDNRLSQAGVAVVALGVVITLIGLFPGVVGLDPTPGIGILQILVILGGFAVTILGAYIFVQSNYYAGIKHNLAQQIALRLSLTGLLIATASGLADVLGFGSHPPGPNQRPLLGPLQVAGMIGGFVIASIGVVMFAVMGHSEPPSNPDD